MPSASGPATSRSRCDSPTGRPTGRSPTRRWRRSARRLRSRSPSSCKAGSVTTSVAVFGAGGYTGALAARLLHRRPAFELRLITGRTDAGRRLDEMDPHHRVPLTLEELDRARHTDRLDAAVVAYPHGAAAELVYELRDRGVRVVDLSA